MKPKEVAEFLSMAVNAENMPAIFIWGPPGVGKSRVCFQVAQNEKIDFIDMRLSMMDPTDIKGLPFPDDKGKSRFLPPASLPTEGRGILLLDEMNLAAPLVQASAYQLVYDRRSGEAIIPPGWLIIAAGNKAEHGANVFKMAAPLRNRFIHIDFELDLENWTEYAVKNGLAPEVIGFIRFRPDILYSFHPERHENAFPTPRSWEFVSRILKGSRDLKPSLLNSAISGAIGNGAGLEFKTYLELHSSLPDINDILNGKNYVPDKMDLGCAVITALVMRARPDQFERLLRYCQDNLDNKEMAVLMLRLMCLKDKKAVMDAPSWKNLAREYYDLLA